MYLKVNFGSNLMNFCLNEIFNIKLDQIVRYN